jgi:hypothetical protein
VKKFFLHIFITLYFAVIVVAVAAEIVEATSKNQLIDSDLGRLGVAFIVGSIVQGLTLLASGRWFERLERFRSRQKIGRAIINNVAEVLLTGIAAAAAVALARGFDWFGGLLSLEFVAAATAGSIGAEGIFNYIEEFALKRAKANDEKKSGGDS